MIDFRIFFALLMVFLLNPGSLSCAFDFQVEKEKAVSTATGREDLVQRGVTAASQQSFAQDKAATSGLPRLLHPFLSFHVKTASHLLTLLGVCSGGVWTLGRLAPPPVEVDPKPGGSAA